MANPERTERPKKYAPLARYLNALPGSIADVTFHFDEIERVIGEKLPRSAFDYREWWANQEGGSRAPHWRAAGFKVERVDLAHRIVTFRRNVLTPAQTPRALSLQQVITEVNQFAQGRRIGELQEWRKRRQGNSRLPSRRLFYRQAAPNKNYAFHVGGLDELQFNVGFEPVDGVETFRHGIAFSLQPTREVPESDVVDLMVPKIERFNEFLRIYPDAFAGFKMWHWPPDDDRSDAYPIAPIPDWQVEPGYFIFVGRLQAAHQIDVELILDDFDRLMPVYEYVEGTEPFPAVARERGGFRWSPGNKARVPRTTVERKPQTVEKSLRHNVLQDALYNLLEETHGFDNTSGEQNCGNGTPVDVAVRDEKGYVYYEIKTGISAQACIREALGQLLEYAFWPGAQRAYRLVIVGEGRFDDNAKAYITFLREKFSLPVEYQQLDMDACRLR